MAGDRPLKGIDRLRTLLATAGGVGLAPVAPGTFGSLPGLVFAWLAWKGGPWTGVIVVVVLVVVGTWAADGAARVLGESDPGRVVIDEVAGQVMTLLFLEPTWRVLAAGFFLFRLFDVLKPFPARQLERIDGGSGIMADDLAAGVYANLVLQAIAYAYPGILGLM
jgi:phosphatidylglycerophosphatase A